MSQAVNLALQGGGAHGAFTWGALDRILEDRSIEIEGITATSAGAMNAVALKHGWVGTAAPARGRGSRTSGSGVAGLDGVIGEEMLDWLRYVWPSPAADLAAARVQPRGARRRRHHPRALALPVQPGATTIRCAASSRRWSITGRAASTRGPKLFVSATNVRDGRPRIFQGSEITTDAILASACLPTLYQAIEIDDPKTGRREAYWDGGYMGNPALYPLHYHTRAPDIVIVHINPLYREELPHTAGEIVSRINEITFNASLLRELRNIDFVNRLLDDGTIAPGRMKRNFVHSVSDDALMNQLGLVTKMAISRTLLLQLRDAGRAAMDRFLAEHRDKLGAPLLDRPPGRRHLARLGRLSVATAHTRPSLRVTGMTRLAREGQFCNINDLTLVARRRRPLGPHTSAERLAESRQPGALEHCPHRRPAPAPRRLGDGREVDPVPSSSTRKPSGSRRSTPWRASVRAGKSAAVQRDQRVGARRRLRRRGRAGRRVGQRQGRDELAPAPPPRPRGSARAARAISARAAGSAPSGSRRVARAHSSRMRADHTGVNPPSAAGAEQHLAHHRRKQHAGVENRPRPGPSRPEPQEQRLEVGGLGQRRMHRMVGAGPADVEDLRAPPGLGDAAQARLAEAGEVGGVAARAEDEEAVGLDQRRPQPRDPLVGAQARLERAPCSARRPAGRRRRRRSAAPRRPAPPSPRRRRPCASRSARRRRPPPRRVRPGPAPAPSRRPRAPRSRPAGERGEPEAADMGEDVEHASARAPAAPRRRGSAAGRRRSRSSAPRRGRRSRSRRSSAPPPARRARPRPRPRRRRAPRAPAPGRRRSSPPSPTPVTARSAATSASRRASAQAAFGCTTAASPKRSMTTPGRPSASAWTSR